MRLLCGLALLLALGGCHAMWVKLSPDARRADYVENYRRVQRVSPQSEWAKESEAALAAILRGDVILGMTERQVIASIGEPERVYRRMSRAGPRATWAYGFSFVFFEPDQFGQMRVTAWSD